MGFRPRYFRERYLSRLANCCMLAPMRVLLLYPPPWKIPDQGCTPDPVDGPPKEFTEGDLDVDFFQLPYGLLSLAANARRAGHHVKVLNLSAYKWSDVETLLPQLSPDVVGLSCWTANRRGVQLAARLIKRGSPKCYVVVGGPHATPFPTQILTRWPEVDCVVLGEGEATLLDILTRIEKGVPVTDVPGAATRENNGDISIGAKRPNIVKLDELASVHTRYPTHIVMTSRGCPWNCTFCGAETSWGRGFRSLSVERVLDEFERALEQVKVRVLLVKDDTFTANRKRVIEICRGIRQRKLRFLWSCDTRVDVLDDELLREMRLAGCERLSLGVESGSPSILKAINKRITVEQIAKSADTARRYGVRTRFYMMLGNRGETEATFHESLAFLERAKPSSYIFSCLSIYPGTDDYEQAVQTGRIRPDCYFDEPFQELKIPFDATEHDARMMNDWFMKHRGVQACHVPGVSELREVLKNLGEHHAAHLDLAEALIDGGELDAAEFHLNQAEALGSPVVGLILNARACIAAKRNDYALVKDLLVTAANLDPQHYLLLRNAQQTKAWFESGSRGPLRLDCRHEFQLFERTQQPALPGPLPNDWNDWEASTCAPTLELKVAPSRKSLSVLQSS
jgi:anaerobic magnesium-protoporphyrin IX monomethyl ester cyclase